MEIRFWQVLIGTSLRYLVFAGFAYGFFYVAAKNKWLQRKIQPKLPAAGSVKNEILFSISTILIFAGVIYITVFSPWRSFTKMYDDLLEYGLTWLILSFPVVLILHDTWFYWMHRFMHWKKVYPYVHQIHHRSHNPTPFAAFSFHPLEAIIEIAILPVIALIIPVHAGIIALFGLYMIVTNVIGHLGFEVFPSWFLKNRFTRMFTSSTHHNLHHHYSKGNYGLYFNFWDRLMGTDRDDYESTFNAIVSKKDHQ